MFIVFFFNLEGMSRYGYFINFLNACMPRLKQSSTCIAHCIFSLTPGVHGIQCIIVISINWVSENNDIIWRKTYTSHKAVKGSGLLLNILCEDEKT